MNIEAAKQQAMNARSEAMERQRAFSWIAGRYASEVQAGVYLRYSQAHFQKYKMPAAK